GSGLHLPHVRGAGRRHDADGRGAALRAQALVQRSVAHLAARERARAARPNGLISGRARPARVASAGATDRSLARALRRRARRLARARRRERADERRSRLRLRQGLARGGAPGRRRLPLPGHRPRSGDRLLALRLPGAGPELSGEHRARARSRRRRERAGPRGRSGGGDAELRRANAPRPLHAQARRRLRPAASGAACATPAARARRRRAERGRPRLGSRCVSLIVQKYGGTSVGSVERIRAVAERVARVRAEGHALVVVVSAMSGETNRLLALGRELAEVPDPREMDALVATGEQVSAALLAIALNERGVPARSLL